MSVNVVRALLFCLLLGAGHANAASVTVSGGSGSDLLVSVTSPVVFDTNSEFTNFGTFVLLIDDLWPTEQPEAIVGGLLTSSISGSQGSVWGLGGNSGVSILGGVYDFQDLIVSFGHESGPNNFGATDQLTLTLGTITLPSFPLMLPASGSYNAVVLDNGGNVVTFPEAVAVTVVPVPAAVWLLATALAPLAGRAPACGCGASILRILLRRWSTCTSSARAA